MKTSRNVFIIAGISAIAAFVVYLVIQFRQSDKKITDYLLPELRKVEMQLANLTADRADMHVKMLIYNPAPVGLDIDSLKYTVSLEGTEIVKSTYPHPVKLFSKKESSISLPLTFKFKNLKSLQDEMEKEKRESGDYHINATIFINNKLIPKKSFNLEFDKTLPMIWFPEVSLKGINVDKVKLNGGTLVANMEIKNRNVFDLSFKDLSYKVKLGDNDWIGGEKPEVVDIPAKRSKEVSMPVDLKLGEIAKSMLDLLLKREDLHYEMKMKANLVSNNRAIEESKIQMDASGTMKSIKEAATGKKE